jgi:hypothetical protein
MPAPRAARRAVPAAAAFALSCAALAGRGGSGGPSQSAASTPPAGGSSSSAGNASTSTGKLTGNFRTDFKNIGGNIPIPPSPAGSLATLQQHDRRHLRQVAAYCDKLAAEAPPQAGTEIRLIVSACQELAGSIVSGSTGSLNKLEQQMGSLTTSGPASSAFKRPVVFVTTKCA